MDLQGDPDELARGYEAMVAELPQSNLALHACARTPDGILLVDTCPSKEVFDAFAASDDFQALLARYGLGEPSSVVGYPVVRAYAAGERVA